MCLTVAAWLFRLGGGLRPGFPVLGIETLSWRSLQAQGQVRSCGGWKMAPGRAAGGQWSRGWLGLEAVAAIADMNER